MNVSKQFQKDLQRFDPDLRCRFDVRPQILPPPLARFHGRPFGSPGRFRVEIRNARTKTWEHVLWVMENDGGFREPGQDTLARLAETDARRFGVGGDEWENGGRRRLMNLLGLKEDETDPFMEKVDELVAHRYHAMAAELADRIRHIIGKDMSACAPAGSELAEIHERHEIAQEVEHAIATGKGVLIKDKKLGVTRVK